MGQRVVQRHLAHRVAQPHVGDQCAGGRGVGPMAAPGQTQTCRFDQRRHLVETLRVTRHDHQQRALIHRCRVLQPGRQQHRLFAFAGHCGQQHGPLQRSAPGMAACQQGGVRRHVELQIAADEHVHRPRLAQALRVAFSLRQHQGQASHRRPDQRVKTLALALALQAQPRICEHHRHTAGLRGMQQVGPDFGLHQHAHGGLEMIEEAVHHTGRVIRQPGLSVSVVQQRQARLAASRRAVGQQQAHAGALSAQGVDQGGSSARFAQRHRMHPHRAARRAAVV